MQARNIEALNHALAGVPEERVRYHLCWGSWQGPHVHDLSLRDIVDLLLRVQAQAYSIEAATPRHAYEWRVWEDVRLPAGQALKRSIEGISQRMLTITLRGLERDGLVKRTLFPTIPPRVDYELTDVGRTLLAPVMALVTWANTNQENIQNARVRYDAS